MTRATAKNEAKNKNRKPLQTTLGKAPVSISSGEVDFSHVQKPIDTSIFGLREVLTLFKTATEEVQNYVTHECDIMYECRICRTIFRSLANFVLHKRKYCQELYGNKKFAFSNENLGDTTIYIVSDEEEKDVDEEHNANVEKEQASLHDSLKEKEDGVKAKNKRSLCTILPRLINKQESSLITEECLQNAPGETKSPNTKIRNNVLLERINDTKSGVFQTTFLSTDQEFDYMRTEVMEIHNVLENNEAVIGTDGKIIRAESEKNSLLTCTKCDETFSTKKTLRCHVKYRHNGSRQIYKCTDCSDTFANTWGVFRHLYKAHRKTPAQVKKLRSQICNNLISRCDDWVAKNNEETGNKVVGVQEKLDLENKQWLNDLESDNDLQICAGCGRKFERKAALNSHSHFCTKRIALCNSIKETNTKRLQEGKGKVSKSAKATEFEEKRLTEVLRRRKPLVAHKILRFDYYKEDVKKNEDIKQENSAESAKLKDSVDECVEEKVSAVNSEEITSVVKDNEPVINAEPVEIDVKAVHIEVLEEENTALLDNPEPLSENVATKEVLNDAVESATANKRKIKSSDKGTSSAKRKCKEWHALHFKSINYIDKEKITCLPCSKVFKSNKSLMKHMAGHFNWNRYECKTCQHRSYQKSKCENHVEKVHDIKDKDALDNYILRMPHKKTLELSRDFVRYVKKCNNLVVESIKPCQDTEEKEVNEVTPDVGEVSVTNKEETVTPLVDLPPADEIEDDNLKPKDCSVRKMIMEVIFGSDVSGSSPAVKDQVSVTNDANSVNEAEKDDSNLTQNNESHNRVESQGNSSPSVKDQVSVTNDAKSVNEAEKIDSNLTLNNESHNRVESQGSVTTSPIKDSRPVRNRTATVKEDFLYDMTQILKLKPSKPKSSIDVVQKPKPLKMYTRKTKTNSTPPTKLVNNKNFKLIDDINMNNKTITMSTNTS